MGWILLRRTLVAGAITIAVTASIVWIVIDQREPSAIALVAPGGTLVVEVANTPATRATGLSNRSGVNDDGLLLAWNAPGEHPIWVSGMRFALDLVWLDANALVVAVLADVPPCDRNPCPLYEPPGTDRSTGVLELPAGVAARYEIRVGSKIRHRDQDLWR